MPVSERKHSNLSEECDPANKIAELLRIVADINVRRPSVLMNYSARLGRAIFKAEESGAIGSASIRGILLKAEKAGLPTPMVIFGYAQAALGGRRTLHKDSEPVRTNSKPI